MGGQGGLPMLQLFLKQVVSPSAKTDDVLKKVHAMYPSDEFPDRIPGTAQWATSATSDLVITCPASAIAMSHPGPTWRYLFSKSLTYRNHTQQVAKGMGDAAWHGIEL